LVEVACRNSCQCRLHLRVSGGKIFSIIYLLKIGQTKWGKRSGPHDPCGHIKSILRISHPSE
jgi:hypothetical protein